jgi:hypothetical protein
MRRVCTYTNASGQYYSLDDLYWHESRTDFGDGSGAYALMLTEHTALCWSLAEHKAVCWASVATIHASTNWRCTRWLCRHASNSRCPCL